MMWFRQMAQLSTTISQAHRATAFHLTITSQYHESLRAVGFVYLLDLELLLVRIIGALGDGLALGGASSGFLHLHVCHIEVLVEIWMVSVRDAWRQTTEAS
jgi:hypothetical protein